MSQLNRAVVFAHYDQQDVVDPYVYYYLARLKDIAGRIVFVSTAKLGTGDVDDLERFGCEVILRNNIGYDFMSYQSGISSLDLAAYDQVVICNDSVYGPFFDLAEIFEAMKSKPGVDFWGMTSNSDIAFHLQSYFMVFNKPVLQSKAFHQFWKGVKVLESKRDIIQQYEVGLSQALIKAGFTAVVYAEYKVPVGSHLLAMAKRFTPAKLIDKLRLLLAGENIVPRVNVSHFHWKELLVESGMPFLKIELLRDNPMNINIGNYENVIRSISNYDCRLIRNHLERLSVPQT